MSGFNFYLKGLDLDRFIVKTLSTLEKIVWQPWFGQRQASRGRSDEKLTPVAIVHNHLTCVK